MFVEELLEPHVDAVGGNHQHVTQVGEFPGLLAEGAHEVEQVLSDA